MASRAGDTTLFIVGAEDQPLFEASFGPSFAAAAAKAARGGGSAAAAAAEADRGHMSQFIAHAALDVVDEKRWTTSEAYLKEVDRFHDSMVSAYLTSGAARFILLHSSSHEDGIHRFFQGVHELFIEITLNPFREATAPIASARFRRTVAALAERHL